MSPTSSSFSNCPCVASPLSMNGSSAVSCLTVKYGYSSGGEGVELNHSVKAVDVCNSYNSREVFDNVSVFVLPGSGDVYDDRCGIWVHPLSCPNFGQFLPGGSQHSRFVVKHSCGRAVCPECYEAWAVRLGNRASDRIIGALGLYKKAGVDLGRVNHWVFSPPQGWAIALIGTLDGFKRLRAEAVRVMKLVGVKGGALVFHPFRQNDPKEDNFNPDLPVMCWYLSPHFHVIGCGYLKKSDDFYKETGWVYKKLDRRATIAGTLIYTLTHCGVNEYLHSLTYFGVFSYNKVVVDKEVIVNDFIECKGCGAYLHKYGWLPGEGREPDWSNDLGEYVHKVVIRTYRLKGFDPPRVVKARDIFLALA